MDDDDGDEKEVPDAAQHTGGNEGTGGRVKSKHDWKPDLIRSLNDLIDGEAQIWEIASTIPTQTDPLALARIPALITRRLVERCGDILRAGVAGMQAEPELAPVISEGGKRHRAGTAIIAGRLADFGALRDDLSRDDAAITMAALADTTMRAVLAQSFYASA